MPNDYINKIKCKTQHISKYFNKKSALGKITEDR